VTSTSTADKAVALHALHEPGRLLILPCAWDVTSARLLCRLPGVNALGTTSAGIAAAHGVLDGQVLDVEVALRAVADIAAATDLPVSADLEWGYGRTPAQVGDVVTEVLAAGAVGINLEDVAADGTSLVDPAEHAARIGSARAAAGRAGIALFVSGRTDVWWRQIPADPAGQFADGVRRLRAYREAGADSLFAPGFPAATRADPAAAPTEPVEFHALAELATALGGAPLHLLASSSLPDRATLIRCGVQRVSTGSALYRTGLAAAAQACAGLVGNTAWPALAPAETLTYGVLATLLSR
jgi:2-methylisocitrate lyase-like PEP mutase family enzyme